MGSIKMHSLVCNNRQVVLNTDLVFSTMETTLISMSKGYITPKWLLTCAYQFLDNGYNDVEEHLRDLLANELSENIELQLDENTMSYEDAESALEVGNADINTIIDDWLPHCFEVLDPIVYGNLEGVEGYEKVKNVKWLSNNIVLIETGCK